MAKKKESYGILFDTGFLIRLNRPKDPLHGNARGYLKFFLSEGHPVFVSTIALAEYAVRDEIENLPMRYLRVVPFNIDHAQRAGGFAEAVLKNRDQLPESGTDRTLIKDDTKMFAQADMLEKVTHFLTADKKCESVYKVLKEQTSLKFKIISLSTPFHESFGMLDFDDEN